MSPAASVLRRVGSRQYNRLRAAHMTPQLPENVKMPLVGAIQNALFSS